MMSVIESRQEISLKQLVGFSYELCSLVHEEYKSITDKVLDMITDRLVDENELDEIDGDDELHITQYGAEMYLRRLYCKLKEQSMDVVDGKLFAPYIGSRQQCLYGCICFVMIFFSMFNSIDLMVVKNFDWFHNTVIQGGCTYLMMDEQAPLSQDDPPSSNARCLIHS